MDETNVKVSFSNSVTNAKKLDTYAEKLKEIYGILSAIDKGQLAQLGDFNITLTKVKDNTQNIGKNTSKFAKNMNTAFNIGKIALFSKKIYGLGRGIAELTTKSSSYVENLNLLEVAYANINRKTGEFNEDIKVTSGRIEKLISNMSEVYGLDESDLTRTFGIFKQLANAMELPTQTAENLSELMVKMRQDIASLYNLDLDRAGNALQSALAGQVRPIRTATGADITEKTLQKTVDNLGLDTTISKLSFVEKRLIMVISLTNQLRNSQGDYGRTIESVANQTKVLHDQWERLTRAIGNVFNPLIKSILPVVNGVLMALTEIANIIASLLGFKLDEFDYSGLTGVADTTQDIIDGMDEAGASVDKLKSKLSGLRSFDKLNVITTPSDSGKSSSGVSGGINPKILEAFNSAFDNYDDKLEKVRMKANDIRDSIMEWLGFTKEINPLTGEIEWKYGGIGKTFENIWQSITNLSPSMKILLAGIGILTASKTIKALGKLVEHFKSLSKFNKVLVGTGGLLMGFELISAGMDEINKKGLTLKGTFEVLGGTISNVLGGAMIGSIFGPWGTAIGAFAGLIKSVVEGIKNYKNEFDKMADSTIESLKPIQDYNNELERQFKIIDENAKNKNLTLGVHQGLFEELQKITDENGKVQSGYEKRAEFIITELNKAYGLEIKMVDGVIQEYDKQKKKIQEVIEQERIKVATEIANEKYKLAIQEQTNAYNNLTEAENKHNEAVQNVKNFENQLKDLWDKNAYNLKNVYGSYENYIKAQKEGNKTYQTLINAEQKAQKELDNSEKKYKETQKAILVYNNVVTSAYEGNVEEVEYWMQKLLANYDQETDIYTKMAGEAEASYRTRKEIAIQSGEEINASDEALFNEKYINLVNALKKEVDAINSNEDDYVNAWIMVATHSKDMFLDNFDDLPDDIQQKVVDKMYDLGYDISDELQKGINKINPEIKFKTNLPNVSSKVNEWFSDYNKTPLSNLINLGSNTNKVFSTPYKYSALAGGGMPEVGNLFLMNEKEPELLGTIGGKSFVANQNQMMDLLDKKIGNAQSKPINATFVIQVGDKELARQVINDLQDIAKTDGKPITIGG